MLISLFVHFCGNQLQVYAEETSVHTHHSTGQRNHSRKSFGFVISSQCHAYFAQNCENLRFIDAASERSSAVSV